MPYTQDTRCLKLATPFGDEVLIPRSLSGTEGLSELFHFEVDAVSPQAGLEFEKIVGENVTLALELAGSLRFFNGIVARFSHRGIYSVQDERDTHVCYRLVVVPWLWKLTRSTNCRVFENKNVVDIVKHVFDKHKCTDYEFADLSETYDPIEYCVQYKETDFDFVSRLLEQHGLGYAFRHENGKHQMVIFDTSATLPEVPDFKTLQCGAAIATGRLDQLEDWTVDQEFPAGVYTMNGFDFKNPSGDLVAPTTCRFPMGGNSGYELYDFDPFLRFDCVHEPPADSQRDNTSYGPKFAKLRMESEEAAAHQIQAAGVCPQIAPGHHFTLEGHFNEAFNKKRYLVSRVQHFCSQPLHKGHSTYENHLTSLPESIPYRPLLKTPKPTVHGTQTATVVGPDEEEIHCDKFGRVRIRFPWDRYYPGKAQDVCWARVAQNAAGRGFGALFTPRVGWEVVVTFLDGDPDLPLITGVVYNGEQPVPYELDQNKTQSGIKTRSTKGGTETNFNELRFEDKKGSEEFFMHAEKNMTVKVKESESETVGGGITTSAGGSIARNSSSSISRTAKEDITDKAAQKLTVVSGKDMKLTSGQ